MPKSTATPPTTNFPDRRSNEHLQGVHPDLVAVMQEARQRVAFIITDGLRTDAEQAALVASGASRTMNSRHLTGHAVDVAALLNGKVRWDWPLYTKLAAVVKTVAKEKGVPIVWGGDWRAFKDGPHFELDRKTYP